MLNLEHVNLTVIHTFLTLFGAGFTLYVMALIGYEHEDDADPIWVQWSRRMYLGGGALALLWSLNYSETRNWQPWPPEIAFILAWVAMLAVRAIAIHARIKREGHRNGLVQSVDKSPRKT